MARGIQFRHPGGDVVKFRIEIDSAGLSEDVPVGEFLRMENDPTWYGLVLRDRPVWAGLDGDYKVDIWAIDDAGNPSEEVAIPAVPFDFVPPPPVTEAAPLE